MFSQPNKIKFSKVRKGRLGRLNFKSNSLKFGDTGLKSVESGTISFRQLESARQAISRKIKRGGKLWLRIYPTLPITSKPLEVRMGKGKGNVDYWSARVKGGTVLFELCGIRFDLAKLAFKTGSAKLSVKTKVFI
jgi:large subunit ribosomal protein L16